MVDLDARAGGNQRLALCNHFCLSLVVSPLAPPPPDFLRVCTRRTRVLARARKRTRRDLFWLNVHAHDRSSKCILIPDAVGMGLHYVGVSTNTHARLRKRLRGADAMLKRLDPARFCASSSSAPHKAHICVIVPAGSIRPMLVRRTRSYPTVRLKSTRAILGIFKRRSKIRICRTSDTTYGCLIFESSNLARRVTRTKHIIRNVGQTRFWAAR